MICNCVLIHLWGSTQCMKLFVRAHSTEAHSEALEDKVKKAALQRSH